MCVGRIWEKIGTNTEQIKIVFTVIAAIYVLVQYQSSLSEAAVKQTMSFQARHSEGDLLKAHLDLDSMLLNPDNQKLLAASKKPSEEIDKLVKTNKYERDVITLADFYGQLATCVQSGVCKAETACAVFKSRIVALWNDYYDLFVKDWGTWGQNLMKPTFDYFSKNCG